jgi:hypothetical protein
MNTFVTATGEVSLEGESRELLQARVRDLQAQLSYLRNQGSSSGGSVGGSVSGVSYASDNFRQPPNPSITDQPRQSEDLELRQQVMNLRLELDGLRRSRQSVLTPGVPPPMYES